MTTLSQSEGDAGCKAGGAAGRSSGGRAAMVLRDDAFRVLGGDLVQAEMTVRALGRLGWEVVLATSAQVREVLEEQPDLALVHFLHLPAVRADGLAVVRRAGLPYVVSPVFWDPTTMWFEQARGRTQKWRVATALLGVARTARVYGVWRSLRRRFSERWRFERTCLGDAAMVLPNSLIELREVERYYRCQGALGDASILVPNGVDAERFADVEGARREFCRRYNTEGFVLEVARIEPAKNQLGVIRALADIAIPIVFVGAPHPLSKEYYRRCRTEGAGRGATLFLGELPHNEIVGAYAAASVHVLPSWRETPGLASLEAAASGCCVVSTSRGSAREYFGDGIEYCEPDSVESIRSAVMRSSCRRAECEALRSLVLDRYTWDDAARATALAYRLVIAGHR